MAGFKSRSASETQVAGAQALTDHVAAWAEHLRQKGDTPQHVRQRTGRALRLLEATAARYWSHIDPERIEAVLVDWRDVGGMAVATCNSYRGAVKQFCRWMERSGRAPRSPVVCLSAQNPEPHRRRVRRALSEDECRRLLEAAGTGPTVQGVPGPERTLLYRLALETGLRFGELKTLQRRHLDLDRMAAVRWRGSSVGRAEDS